MAFSRENPEERRVAVIWLPPKEFPDLSAASVIAVDCETYDPNLRKNGPGAFRKDGHIVGVAVGTDDGKRWYFPVRHESNEANLPPENVFRWLRDQLRRPEQPKVGANLMYDAEFLSAEGVEMAGDWLDVQIAEPLLDESAISYSLEAISTKYLGVGKESSDLDRWCARAYGGRPDSSQRKNIYRTPPSIVGPYAEGDVDRPLRIIEKQLDLLENQGLSELFSVESALLPMLVAMRKRGVRVDVTAAESLDEEWSRRILAVQGDLSVDVWAANSIAKVCDKNGIPYPRTPKTKAPSFTSEWLESHDHPIMRTIRDVRRLDKARGTFIRGYVLDAHVDGFVRTRFNPLRSDQGGAISGRFSSANPNLQNVPARDEEIGPLVRGLFLPDEGEDWVRFDWSQIEFRCLVHHGIGRGADVARRMYREDSSTDFHRMVSDLTGVPRKPAKTINFGLVYGMGKAKLARSLELELSEAENMFSLYHEKLPFVRDTYQAAMRLANETGVIRTLLGRTRRFDLWEEKFSRERKTPLPEDKAREKYGRNVQRAYTYKALNALLQGDAADIMKKAMVKIWQSGICTVLGPPLLTVHDELDWSAPRTPEAAEALLECQHIMETCVELSVPLVADVEVGSDWGHLK